MLLVKQWLSCLLQVSSVKLPLLSAHAQKKGEEVCWMEVEEAVQQVRGGGVLDGGGEGSAAGERNDVGQLL